MWHKVTKGYLDNLEAVYKCIIKDGKKNVTVDFHFQAGAIGGVPHIKLQREFKDVPLDDNAYLLVDDNSYMIKLDNNRKERKVAIYGIDYRTYGGTYNDLYCTIHLTPEIESKLSSAKTIMFKFATGGDETILQATDSQVKKLREFFITASQ